MCTRFQVSSTRSGDLAEQIQGSARLGLRVDLLRACPNRATFQAPPSVAEERGGFRGGGHLSPPRIFTVHMMRDAHPFSGVPREVARLRGVKIHSMRTASTRAVVMPASLPPAVAAPPAAAIVRVPPGTEPAIQ